MKDRQSTTESQVYTSSIMPHYTGVASSQRVYKAPLKEKNYDHNTLKKVIFR